MLSDDARHTLIASIIARKPDRPLKSKVAQYWRMQLLCAITQGLPFTTTDLKLFRHDDQDLADLCGYKNYNSFRCALNHLSVRSPGRFISSFELPDDLTFRDHIHVWNPTFLEDVFDDFSILQHQAEQQLRFDAFCSSLPRGSSQAAFKHNTADALLHSTQSAAFLVVHSTLHPTHHLRVSRFYYESGECRVQFVYLPHVVDQDACTTDHVTASALRARITSLDEEYDTRTTQRDECAALIEKLTHDIADLRDNILDHSVRLTELEELRSDLNRQLDEFLACQSEVDQLVDAIDRISPAARELLIKRLQA